jgi:carbon-monoxide dehydrogenase small subunit
VSEEIEIVVNGEQRRATAEVRMTLADFLRDRLALTGTHLGCEHGVCGACTVMVDGVGVRSCLMLAVQARGREVLTIEGLGDPDHLDPLQQAFRETHAFQCGFCTPGFVMASLALLRDNPSPDEEAAATPGNAPRTCAGAPQAALIIPTRTLMFFPLLPLRQGTIGVVGSPPTQAAEVS